MKKFTALFMAAAMVFSMSAMPAFAGETEVAEGEVLEINWDPSIEDQLEAVGMSGSFYSFDDLAVKFYMPDVLQEVEMTDEQVEGGMVGLFSTEDGSATISIVKVPNGGMTLEEFKAELDADEDVTFTEMSLINGIEMLTYDMASNDSAEATFATDADEFVEFAFSPASDENFKSVAQLITVSIQPEEAAETEAE